MKTRIPIDFAAAVLSSPSSGAIHTSSSAVQPNPVPALTTSKGGSTLSSAGTMNTPLALAVARFNRELQRDLRLPMWPETVRMAASVAELSGHPDIGLALRSALNDSPRVEVVA